MHYMLDVEFPSENMVHVSLIFKGFVKEKSSLAQQRPSDDSIDSVGHAQFYGYGMFYLFVLISIHVITKTCLYSFDPLKPHFYTVKLEFTGVYINFLNFAQKHRLWVLVRTASSRRF